MMEQGPEMMNNGDNFALPTGELPTDVLGHGMSEEMLQPLDLRPSDELFQEYRALAAAAKTLSGDLAPTDLARAREITGAWLAGRKEERPVVLPVPVSPAPAGTAGATRTELDNPAYTRLEALAAHLRQVPELQSIRFKGLHFKLDAAETLVQAMRRRDAEQTARRDAGLPEEPAPDLGRDLVSAVEIVDWLPNDRATRAEFTKGLPEYAHPIPGRLRHIMEVLVPGLRKRVATQVGAAIAAEAVLRPEQTAQLEKLYSEAREYRTSDGRQLLLVTYMDRPEYDWLTAKVDAGQRAKYVEEGVWKPDAKGTPVRGKNVRIYAFMDPETDEPMAALRKVEASTWRQVRQTPSFRKFVSTQVANEEDGLMSGAFTKEGLALFKRLAHKRPVIEIAGLWKDRKCPTDVKTALYRYGIQDSIERNELWFMGTVRTVYKDLTNTFGEDIVRTIGESIEVEDEDANSTTTITPIIIDSQTFCTNLIDNIEKSEEAGDVIGLTRHEALLWELTRGMNAKGWMSLSQGDRTRIRTLAMQRAGARSQGVAKDVLGDEIGLGSKGLGAAMLAELVMTVSPFLLPPDSGESSEQHSDAETEIPQPLQAAARTAERLQRTRMGVMLGLQLASAIEELRSYYQQSAA